MSQQFSVLLVVLVAFIAANLPLLMAVFWRVSP